MRIVGPLPSNVEQLNVALEPQRFVNGAYDKSAWRCNLAMRLTRSIHSRNSRFGRETEILTKADRMSVILPGWTNADPPDAFSQGRCE